MAMLVDVCNIIKYDFFGATPCNSQRPTDLDKIMRIFLLLCTVTVGCQRGQNPVVVYCAQDQPFATSIFAEFDKDSDKTVAAKFDTEANKSVGIALELSQEKERPRCDVHWNNEILATIRLSREGVYEPYRSPNAEGFPAWTKSDDWQAFAERARVLIINTELVADTDRPTSIFDLTQPQWKGKVAIAKPIFGTTATHAACLWNALGEEKTKAFYRELKANDIAMVAGNKQVAEGVGSGRYAVGFTDTDDALIELDAGHPVAILFPDQNGIGTLFIPNTVALIRDAPHPERGRELIDFLLSNHVETRLALEGGHQYPLNPELSNVKPHPALPSRNELKRMDVDFNQAPDAWEASQKFLRDEFMR